MFKLFYPPLNNNKKYVDFSNYFLILQNKNYYYAKCDNSYFWLITTWIGSHADKLAQMLLKIKYNFLHRYFL